MGSFNINIKISREWDLQTNWPGISQKHESVSLALAKLTKIFNWLFITFGIQWKKLNFGWIGTNARCTLVRSRSLWAQLLKQMICSDRAFSSSLLRAIIVRNHLPFFKVFSNFVHFCPTFQIFCPFLTFFCPFFPLFLKNRTHALTFWNRPCQSS